MTERASHDDLRLLKVLERAFEKHAGPDGVIDLADLQRALGVRDPDLVRRVLKGFDLNADGVIQKDEFLAGVRTLVFGTDREKLWFAFKLHDRNDDGVLDRDEVMRMISVSIAENDVMARATQPPELLTHALFLSADKNHDGKISFDELAQVVMQRPELLRKMTRNEAIWISPNEDLLAWAKDKRPLPREAVEQSDAWLMRLAVLAFAIVNVAVFVAAMVHASATPFATQVGRALAKCIDVDGALILVPMMRRFVSWLRTTWVARVVPVDESIDFHRIVGHTLFGLAVTHAAAFVVAYAQGHSANPVVQVFFGSRGATGAALLGVFAVMWAFSLSFVRRSQRFELFYFTHLAYVAWFVLAVVHAPSFLVIAGVPLLGFAFEQVMRLWRRGKRANVVALESLRSGVTRIELEKPAGFRASPADYVFLRMPAIARHEWHPFTISSAPERDTLVFHVRSLGNWTAALRDRAQGSGASDLVAFVDGPYGSPSAPIFESTVAVLIGGGIGVTPFASVLESILYRSYASKGSSLPLKKVHFFWLNRDAFSFEWFADLLSELEKRDERGLLDIQLCMTGARTGMATLGLDVAREVMHAGGRSDFVTGLRTQTHFGEPDWPTLLGAIKDRHKRETIEVFYCGPQGLASKVRPLCEKLGMRFRQEKF